MFREVCRKWGLPTHRSGRTARTEPGSVQLLQIPRNSAQSINHACNGSKIRLLLLVAGGRETSASLAGKLGVSPRQVNRYVRQNAAGWRIGRRGVPTHADYWFELVAPRIVLLEAE